MVKRCFFIVVFISVCSPIVAQEFELTNNFLMNLSFVTGTDRGVERNLDDNLSWMQGQGYTHLRFFGIFPNGVHCFPSPTLNANGYPNSSYHEPILELLVSKAALYNITVNFDGWEVIAESNRDTTGLGVGFVTPAELGQVVQDVLDLGVTLVTEEQFGSEYLQMIQAKTTAAGATHETTAGFWYQRSYASLIADAQLASVFNFFPRHQGEADSITASGKGYDIVATLGVCHAFLESPRYYNVPTSLAVGSFGTLQTENWRNVLRFAQIQHHPDRLSIEEQDHGFLIWDGFDFSEYIGNDLVTLSEEAIGERPTVNLVLDLGAIFSGSFIPSWPSLQVSAPAIVGTFTQLGYKVVTTLDSLLPEAELYYVLLAGGTDVSNVAPLPGYISTLLAGPKPVFIQPTYGIPDNNDASSWLPLRSHFGLPPAETQTIFNGIPEAVSYNGHTAMWGGIELYLTPCVEALPSSTIDTTIANVVLSGDVSGQETALIIANGNSWLINSNVVHLEASYVFSSLLDGPLNQPAGADIVIADGTGLVFAEYATDVHFDLPWSGLTRVRRYDPVGEVVFDAELDLGGVYGATLARGELVILSSLFTPCCTTPGDGNHDEVFSIADVTFGIARIFSGGPAPVCQDEADANGDNVINIADVTFGIARIFSGGPAPVCGTTGT